MTMSPDRSLTKTKSYGMPGARLRAALLEWAQSQPKPRRGPQDGFPATLLARLSGVQPRSIHRIVSGQAWVQWNTADRLATAIGCHLADLEETV
jgi:hypothetical protein